MMRIQADECKSELEVIQNSQLTTVKFCKQFENKNDDFKISFLIFKNKEL